MEAENAVRIRSVVERGLASKGRLRILAELGRTPGQLLTKYALEKKTRLRPVDVRSNLRALMEIGWVKEHPYRLTRYEINADDEMVKHTLLYLRTVGYLSE